MLLTATVGHFFVSYEPRVSYRPNTRQPKMLINPLTSDDECTSHATLAACYISWYIQDDQNETVGRKAIQGENNSCSLVFLPESGQETSSYCGLHIA